MTSTPTREEAEQIFLRRFESVKKHAHRTWAAMRDSIGEHEPTINDPQLGTGYIIHGSVASYIRKISKETTGHDCDADRVDRVRTYLKHTYNVVSQGQSERKFVYRLFVRKEWNEWDAVMPIVMGLVRTERENRNWYERKVTPQEAGETRAPAPVITFFECQVPDCHKRFTSQEGLNAHQKAHPLAERQTPKRPRRSAKGLSQPLSESQVSILRQLAKGKVSDKSGYATPRMSDLTGLPRTRVTTSTRRLIDAGLIDSERKGKRTFSYEITDKGREVLDNLDQYRKPYHVLADYMRKVGEVTAKPGQVGHMVSLALNLNRATVEENARRLRDEGWLEIRRDGTLTTAYKWLGALDEQTPDPSYDEIYEELGREMEEVRQEAQPAKKASEALDVVSGRFVPDALEKIVRQLIDLYQAQDNALAQAEKTLSEAKTDTSAQEKLDLISSVLSDFEAGKCSALKALSDIQEGINL